MHYKRTEKALATPVDDELVMFDSESGRYYGLNEVATAIWELLEQPRSIEGLIEILTNEFEVSAETCRQEVEGFLAQLLKRGLVEQTRR